MALLNLWTVLLAVTLFCAFWGPTAVSGMENGDKQVRDYCVIGAGPAGIQLGYFLTKANRDYVIFERSRRPGNFFVRFPRHRKLISINKRHTGQSNKEFNLRHDWNSLLSDNDDLLFTKYTKRYFPHTEVLLKYLQDFQRTFNIQIQFNTEIADLKPEHANGFEGYSMRDQFHNVYYCKTPIIATGIPKPLIPNIQGIEHAVGYEAMSVNPDDYEGLSVMVIGKGNSGFEVASDLYNYANFVHIYGRSRLKFSWETHYVGDIRAVNNEVLDAYMLKSLDGVLDGTRAEDMVIEKRKDGKLIVKSKNADHNAEQNPIREAYDVIIRCTGFKWDDSVFSKNYTKHQDSKASKKFPAILPNYESTLYPGLYFIGPLTHSLDFRKSAGGFIHGFRYTVRTLHRLLEWQNHGVKWQHFTADIDKLAPTLLRRANEASGIYQMYQNLGDVAIVNRKDKTFSYLQEYPLALVPDLVNRTGHEFDPHKHSLVVLSLQFGANFSSVGEDAFREGQAELRVDHAHMCNFLHAVIYYYRMLPTAADMESKSKKEVLPKPDGIHHVLEDFTTIFDGPNAHLLPLRRFLEFFLTEDLRVHQADSCVYLSLTSDLQAENGYMPVTCEKFLMRSEESIMDYMLRS